LPKAKAIVEACVSQTVLFIQYFENKAQEFKPSYYITEIIEKCSLENYLQDHPNSFQIHLSASLLAYAMPIFDQMHDKFENKDKWWALYTCRDMFRQSQRVTHSD
jgi:hypothetical protein